MLYIIQNLEKQLIRLAWHEGSETDLLIKSLSDSIHDNVRVTSLDVPKFWETLLKSMLHKYKKQVQIETSDGSYLVGQADWYSPPIEVITAIYEGIESGTNLSSVSHGTMKDFIGGAIYAMHLQKSIILGRQLLTPEQRASIIDRLGMEEAKRLGLVRSNNEDQVSELVSSSVPKREYKQAILKQQMDAKFSISELKSLCFDMNIDHENIKADTKLVLIEELILYSNRNDKLPELIHRLRALRNDSKWPTAEEVQVDLEKRGNSEPFFSRILSRTRGS